MDEKYLENSYKRTADGYFKKYRSYMEAIEKSPLSKARSITQFDHYALGQMLEQWENIVAMCEADGSIADLGLLPRIAQDVISVSFGTSPLAIIASVQPIEEETGLVYYKRLIAKDTFGNIDADQNLVNPETGLAEIPSGYASAKISDELLTAADGSTVTYEALSLNNTPVRPQSVVVKYTISGTDYEAPDDGSGVVSGAYMNGTVNYTTGVVNLYFQTGYSPSISDDIYADYQVNLETSSDIREITSELTTKTVKAHPYALKGTVGLLKKFQLMKKFGQMAEDDLAMDLTNMINVEIFGDLLRKMVANAQGTTTFDATVPSYYSEHDHRQNMNLYLAKAEKVLVQNAGRGTRSFYIGGATFCEYMSTIEGFKILYDGASITGSHLYGTLGGAPVIRVPQDTNVIATNKAIIGYKGLSVFEAPTVYAPYMPLMVTSMLPMSNPLMNQRAAACWSAVEVLVKQFLTNFTVSNAT